MTRESNARRLEQIARRAERATSPPWASERGFIGRGSLIFAYVYGGKTGELQATLDADFLTCAREDVPWLVARVRQLEGALRELIDDRHVVDGGKLLAESALSFDPIHEDRPCDSSPSASKTSARSRARTARSISGSSD